MEFNGQFLPPANNARQFQPSLPPRPRHPTPFVDNRNGLAIYPHPRHPPDNLIQNQHSIADPAVPAPPSAFGWGLAQPTTPAPKPHLYLIPSSHIPTLGRRRLLLPPRSSPPRHHPLRNSRPSFPLLPAAIDTVKVASIGSIGAILGSFLYFKFSNFCHPNDTLKILHFCVRFWYNLYYKLSDAFFYFKSCVSASCYE